MGWLARTSARVTPDSAASPIYQTMAFPLPRFTDITTTDSAGDVALISTRIHEPMSGHRMVRQRRHPAERSPAASIGRLCLVPQRLRDGSLRIVPSSASASGIRDSFNVADLAVLPSTSSTSARSASSEQAAQHASVAAVPMLVPPLAEQHRIVAKVDELMALCDRLEAAQAERERRRDRLVAASLNRLNEPSSIESREHVQFHLNHLPRLTTRREHIKELRQTILNLAVRGELVTQHLEDEPISQTLARAVEKRHPTRRISGRAKRGDWADW